MPKRRKNNEANVVFQLSMKELTDLTKAFDAVRINALSPAQIKRVRRWEQFFLCGFTDKVGETTEESFE